ncbi:MAG: hypothetical protein IAF38_02820, partial [Bacteroidia bacterium]|nr:hypothetical protein [Bacteroidia bacterium]
FHHGASDYVVKSETQFRKINHSLTTIFKMTNARQETRKYKNLLIAVSIGFALLFGGVSSLQLFAASIFK